MNREFVWAFVCLLPLLIPAHALDSGSPDTPPPSAPFLVVPERAQWTMVLDSPHTPSPIVSPASTASAVSHLDVKQVDVTKTGILYREQITWSNGAQTETWVDGKVRLSQNPIGNGIDLFDPHTDASGTADDAKFDFYRAAWLSLATYAGVDASSGRRCYHFKKLKGNLPGNNPDSSGGLLAWLNAQPAEAWVDIATKRLVAYQYKGQLYHFTYGEPPAVDLTLPPAYAKRLQAYEDNMNPFRVWRPH